MSRSTAIAPANIAFIKYWGAHDLERVVPRNRSLSMTLSRCRTRCTVEHRESPGEDEIRFRAGDGALHDPGEAFCAPVRRQLARLKERAGRGGSFRVATENSFPAAAGLASSASGFTALTLAAGGSLGLELEGAELSSLARLSGSGSAARSAFGGFVQWPGEAGTGEPVAEPLAPPEHWDLRDVIAVVDAGPKPAASREGHRRAASSPYYDVRQQRLPSRLAEVREAVAARDFQRLGPAIEEEAIDLHLITMSSRPPIFYWRPPTLAVLDAVRAMRKRGVPAWATMDAGPNVHVICEPEHETAVAERLAGVAGVESVIRDRVGPAPRRVADHLF